MIRNLRLGALVAALALGTTTLASPAEARDRRRDRGDDAALAIGAGIIGLAVGAAIAQVSGEIDQIFQNLTRDAAIAEARRLAEARAVSGGADAATLHVVEVEDLPLAYLPGNSLRVRVRVVGDIRDGGQSTTA